MRGNYAAMTLREWATLELLSSDLTSANHLIDRWAKLPYNGNVHDALYRLENHGLAVREYRGGRVPFWRLTDSGVQARHEVKAMLEQLKQG